MSEVTDFVALDVETANADFSSICAIGIVHFRKGEPVKALTILVDPEDSFDPINVSIHGISAQQVVGKPTMARVLPVISAALRNTAIVHHSPFDRTALARAAARYGTEGLPCVWLDSLQVARRSWAHHRDNGGYSLSNLARLCGIEFRHHDAAEDARCAGLLVARCIAETGISLQQWIDDIGYESTAVDATAKPRKRSSFNRKHAREGNLDGPLFGEILVFTGQLTLSRSDAVERAAALGCTIADSVTKKTTILVVGDQDLRLTKGQEQSTKYRKAEALRAQGAAIRIVRESDFLLMLADR
jgi:DNA polymerase III subunit epsilon